MKRFIFRRSDETQKRRRDAWKPQFERGLVVNGCLAADDYDEAIVEELLSAAVPLNLSTLYSAGEMPVVRWDSNLESWLRKQGNILDVLREERTRCVLPWTVLERLPAGRKAGNALYFSQRNLPSCMGHAHAFAHHSSTLNWIGLGAPLVYEPFNPLITWAIGKGGSIRGGQSPGPQAMAGNRHGNYPMSKIGSDNTTLPPDYRRFETVAECFQSGIVFLPGQGEELVRNIVRCCRAGLGVAAGNSTAVGSAKADSNGVKIAELGGTWAHATSFAGFRTVKGTEYVFWINSHGGIYGVSDEGEPADGAWMRVDAELTRFCSTMGRYGAPYAVIPESPVLDLNSCTDMEIPFPRVWRR